MGKERFSKASLLSKINDRMLGIEQTASHAGMHRSRPGAFKAFDPDNGFSQVEGRGEELNRLYGQWSALLELKREIESKVRS